MKRGFYARLAWTGIRNNRRLYLPYLLSAILMVAVVYIDLALSHSKPLYQMPGGRTATTVLGFGFAVLALFAAIFLFYAGSFLIRRRKREFGLYNILGMGKFNLGRILIWETVLTFLISSAVGLLAGIAFSKLAELVLLNLIHGKVDFTFQIPLESIGITLGVFALIFALLLIFQLIQVAKAKPVDLMRSESTGEKPPKANWVLGLGGALLLGAAYWIAVSIQDPLAAMNWFFIAVIMVILATYLLLIAGSVLLCRILQRSKRYYYKPEHFVSVSSMAYRMKRNGAGLASICILVTMVLVMISVTACMYFGEEDALRAAQPYDITLEVSYVLSPGEEDVYAQRLHELVQPAAEAAGSISNVQEYRRSSLASTLVDGYIPVDQDEIYDAREAGYPDCLLLLMDLPGYNATYGRDVVLDAGEALMYCDNSAFSNSSLKVGEQPYAIREVLKENPARIPYDMGQVVTITLVVPDLAERDLEITRAQKEQEDYARLTWHYSFDSDASSEAQSQLRADLEDLLLNLEDFPLDFLMTSCQADERTELFARHGGLFFLGILLSVVFLVAAVLIIYYKQVCEGYEDQARFGIMQNVGMTRSEIRRSINSQMRTVFFVPLGLAVLHLAFAFPMLRKMLLLFQINNLPLLIATALVSVALYALFYALVYRATANAYYSIVSGARESR